MSLRSLFSSIIPGLLLCACLGSCGLAFIIFDDLEFATSTASISWYLFVFLLAYYPTVKIYFWIKDRFFNESSEELPEPIAGKLIGFFVLMTLGVLIAAYVMPSHFAYKKQLYYEKLTKDILDESIMAQKAYYEENGLFAKFAIELIKDLDADIQLEVKKADNSGFIIVAHHPNGRNWYQYSWSKNKGMYSKFVPAGEPQVYKGKYQKLEIRGIQF